jgi:hypothetical protein
MLTIGVELLNADYVVEILDRLPWVETDWVVSYNLIDVILWCFWFFDFH